jgi:hypothetical protein
VIHRRRQIILYYAITRLSPLTHLWVPFGNAHPRVSSASPPLHGLRQSTIGARPTARARARIVTRQGLLHAAGVNQRRTTRRAHFRAIHPDKVARVQKGVEHVIRACQIGAVNAASDKQPVDTMLWQLFFRDV